MAVTLTMGVNTDGRREVLGMATGPPRPNPWIELPRGLVRRGLNGVKLVISDAHERLNGKIKRRVDVVGIFPNDASIRRLVGAILMEKTGKWILQRG